MGRSIEELCKKISWAKEEAEKTLCPSGRCSASIDADAAWLLYSVLEEVEEVICR